MHEPIDINDRMPEPLDDVLVFGALAPGEDPEWHLGCQLPDGRWQITDSEPLPLYGVTHWMPMPPDPRPSSMRAAA